MYVTGHIRMCCWKCGRRARVKTYGSATPIAGTKVEAVLETEFPDGWEVREGKVLCGRCVKEGDDT